MTSIKLIVFLLLFSLIGHAQDTLFFKDKQTLVVLIKEISPTEIQYKKLELPDGPMYIISKKDIEKIVFKNGYSEIVKTETTPSAEQSFVVYNNGVNINTEKIGYADAKKRYYPLIKLIDRHPDPVRRDKLMHSAGELSSLKRHQDGTRTGAIIFGGVALGGALLYTSLSAVSYMGYVDPLFAMPPVVFGALGLGLGATSIAINMNLRKKRQAFVDLYNQ